MSSTLAVPASVSFLQVPIGCPRRPRGFSPAPVPTGLEAYASRQNSIGSCDEEPNWTVLPRWWSISCRSTQGPSLRLRALASLTLSPSAPVWVVSHPEKAPLLTWCSAPGSSRGMEVPCRAWVTGPGPSRAGSWVRPRPSVGSRGPGVLEVQTAAAPGRRPLRGGARTDPFSRGPWPSPVSLSPCAAPTDRAQ